jgi:hypothetical protein
MVILPQPTCSAGGELRAGATHGSLRHGAICGVMRLTHSGSAGSGLASAQAPPSDHSAGVAPSRPRRGLRALGGVSGVAGTMAGSTLVAEVQFL